MAKLDRLGWAAGLTVVAFGTRIGIRSTDHAILSDVIGLLPPYARRSRGAAVDRLVSMVVPRDQAHSRMTRLRQLYVLYGDGVRVARTLDRDEMLRILALFLEELIMANARSRCVVHAGVVGWRGRAILLPGASMAGKSRLVEALVRAGASYVSDEYALLDRRGAVHPYPRPLVHRDDAGRRHALHPDLLGGSVARGPLPVGLVVAASYRHAARWRARPLSRAQATLALLAHCVSARMWSREALEIVRRVTELAPALHVTRGEAADAAQRLIAACEASGTETRT